MYGSTIVSEKIHLLFAGLRRPMHAAWMTCLGFGFVFLATAAIHFNETMTPKSERLMDAQSPFAAPLR
jgi:hypothetical protein